MTRHVRILQCVLALLIGAKAAYAQQSSGVTPPQGDYSKEAAVVDVIAVKTRFENDGTSVQELNLKARIQSDAGVQRYGLLTFSYESATQAVEIDYVRVHKPDGTIVVTPADNVQDLDAGITREAPFYSDLREKHVAVKGLSPGDTLEYLVRWRTTKSLAPGQFWYEYNFQHDSIVFDEELQISVPKDRPIKLKSALLTPATSEDNGRRIYTWKTSNLENHSKDADINKAIDANLGRTARPDVQMSSFQNWDEVGKWYWGLQADRIQPSADIRAKAAELTKGSTDSSVILRSVYDFVSTKFRYIGVAFGIGRYQPHSADDILGNQYGDCKDKHTLLASLLKAVGITAYPVLISSNYRLDPDVPSPAQFNHVIGAVPQGADYLWLDTTTEVGPFGYLVPQLRGKQALVIPGDKPAILVTTPETMPFPNAINFKVDGKLNDQGTLNSKMEYFSRGDDEVLVRSVFRQVPQTQWKDLVQQISYNLGFAGTVSEVNAGPPEITTDAYHFTYSYDRKDYPDWSSHQVTIPGLQVGLPQVKEEDAKSKGPIWLGQPTRSVSDVRVELPKGYAPVLPPGVNLEKDYAEYHSSYARDQSVLVSHRELRVKMTQVPEAERKDYQAFAKSIADDVGRYIMVIGSSVSVAPTVQNRFTATLGTAIKSLPDSDNAEAMKFEKEAYSEMGPDQESAVNALKRAVAVDPRFTRDWVLLGSLYIELKHPDEGAEALRSAVVSDPRQPISYRTLALALMTLKHEDEAIKVWQDLLKNFPEDVEATTNLATLLYKHKRYAEAEPILDAEVKANPSEIGPLSQLGVVYLKGGENDKGLATFQKIMALDSSPSTLNYMAYELADANVGLNDALGYAEKALRTQEEASQKVDLGNLKMDDLHGTQQIGHDWDTLGWVNFRLGHTDVAEKYLHASWLLLQDAVVADHLGQLFEQQQRKADAIHIYRLGLATPGSAADAERAQIQDHFARLVPGANLSKGPDLHRDSSASDELSQMRTTKLSRRTVSEGASLEFFALFGPDGKIGRVIFIGDSQRLKSADDMIRSANFQISFPPGRTARIVRRGIISCYPLSGCRVVLYNPDTVTSVD